MIRRVAVAGDARVGLDLEEDIAAREDRLGPRNLHALTFLLRDYGRDREQPEACTGDTLRETAAIRFWHRFRPDRTP